MSKPRTVHTLESLKARTTEYGECWLWDGYVCNGSPYVEHEGKMTAVRKIVTILSGTLARERYYGTNCGEGLCICPDHVVQRTQAEHARAMAHRANTGAIKSLRMVKMTATRRRTHAKLTPELAGEIRNSEDSGPVLAQRYGITRSLVNRIKRGVQWKDATNPFSGLGGR